MSVHVPLFLRQTHHGSPSAQSSRPHVVAVFRVERDDDGRVATLYLADLAGTQDAETEPGGDKQSFSAVVRTNSNLVGALCTDSSRVMGGCRALGDTGHPFPLPSPSPQTIQCLAGY